MSKNAIALGFQISFESKHLYVDLVLMLQNINRGVLKMSTKGRYFQFALLKTQIVNFLKLSMCCSCRMTIKSFSAISMLKQFCSAATLTKTFISC